MKVGYIRVSTVDQNEQRQVVALNQYGVERVFMEKRSGKNMTDRAELKAMLDYIREGDTVVVLSFDRLARNTKDLLEIVERIGSKGAKFVSLHEQIDTTTPQGELMLTVFGALAQFERRCTLERQREGIEIAKEAGKYKGRQPVKYDHEAFDKEIRAWKAGEQTAKATMDKLNLKPNTFYRRAKEWEVDHSDPQ